MSYRVARGFLDLRGDPFNLVNMHPGTIHANNKHSGYSIYLSVSCTLIIVAILVHVWMILIICTRTRDTELVRTRHLRMYV